ncbi:MAG: hypothetical protein IKQ60_02390 [Candidatus Methanomethylophilaceae archaeon]|nr:hypothetical protein [Candidatus Methanomethylophilaceae archaeon]
MRALRASLDPRGGCVPTKCPRCKSGSWSGEKAGSRQLKEDDLRRAVSMYSEGAGCVEASLATGVPVEDIVKKVLSLSGGPVRMLPADARERSPAGACGGASRSVGLRRRDRSSRARAAELEAAEASLGPLSLPPIRTTSPSSIPCRRMQEASSGDLSSKFQSGGRISEPSVHTIVVHPSAPILMAQFLCSMPFSIMAAFPFTLTST